MEIFKLRPFLKSCLWGGEKLKTLFGKSKTENIAESWELSGHKDGLTLIDCGTHESKPLKEFLNKKNIGGGFDSLPLIVKFIDAKENLSVQVHPTAAYAKKRGEKGKNEFWYVVCSEENSGVYCGLKKRISKRELAVCAENGSLLSLMNFIKVKPGDCIYVPAGTIHAIGKGVTICEVQDSSNVTYRLFDFNRIDAYGQKRQLHIKDGVNAALRKKRGRKKLLAKKKLRSKTFAVRELKVENKARLFADKNSFTALIWIEGRGEINLQEAKAGDSFFVSAGRGIVNVSGDCKLLIVKLSSPRMFSWRP